MSVVHISNSRWFETCFNYLVWRCHKVFFFTCRINTPSKTVDCWSHSLEYTLVSIVKTTNTISNFFSRPVCELVYFIFYIHKCTFDWIRWFECRCPRVGMCDIINATCYIVNDSCSRRWRHSVYELTSFWGKVFSSIYSIVNQTFTTGD